MGHLFRPCLIIWLDAPVSEVAFALFISFVDVLQLPLLFASQGPKEDQCPWKRVGQGFARLEELSISPRYLRGNEE